MTGRLPDTTRYYGEWLTAECEAVFVAHRSGLHIARAGSEQTLCARVAQRREKRRGDSVKMCRLCRLASFVACDMDTRRKPTRWEIRNRGVPA